MAGPGCLALLLAFFWTQTEPTVNLDLGVVTDVVLSGDRVTVPVTLVMQGEAQITRLSLGVVYPSRQLSWVDGSLSDALDASGARLQTKEQDVDGEGKKMILLEITSPAPILQGTPFSLNFDLMGEPEVDEEMRLENRGPKAWSIDGAEINAKGLDGSITSIEFIPACFFFMH